MAVKTKQKAKVILNKVKIIVILNTGAFALQERNANANAIPSLSSVLFLLEPLGDRNGYGILAWVNSGAKMYFREREPQNSYQAYSL